MKISFFINFLSQGLVKDNICFCNGVFEMSSTRMYLKVNKNGILSLRMLQSFNWFCHGSVQLISNRKASV